MKKSDIKKIKEKLNGVSELDTAISVVREFTNSPEKDFLPYMRKYAKKIGVEKFLPNFIMPVFYILVFLIEECEFSISEPKIEMLEMKIKKAGEYAKEKQGNNPEPTKPKEKINPRELTKKKHNRLFESLDYIIDEIIEGNEFPSEKVDKLIEDTKMNGNKMVAGMLLKHFKETVDWENQKEGYEFMTKEIKKNLEILYNKLQGLLNRFKATTGGRRRKKKIKEIPYLEKSKKYKVKSKASPIEIDGNPKEVWLFDEKHRRLTRLVSDGGILLKGKTLIGWDEIGSKTITIREKQVEETLKAIQKNKVRTIKKILEKMDKTKGSPKVRISENTLIVKVNK